MRPCGHTDGVKGCVYCRWCLDPSERGRRYRSAWGEPEPTGDPHQLLSEALNLMATVTYPDCTACCGGGGVVTVCCDNAIPATLYATFTEALAELGTLALTYDDMEGAWVGSGEACGGPVQVYFYCDPDFSPPLLYFTMTVTGTATSGSSELPDSCSPLSWDTILPVAGCDPFVNAPVVVSETAP